MTLTQPLALDQYPEIDLPAEGGQTYREIRFAGPETLPIVDLTELYAEVESALPNDRGVIVQLVSVNSAIGGERVALELAWASASVLGKTILLLNCSKPRRQVAGAPQTTFEAMDLESGMVKMAGQEVYIADLRGWHTKNGDPADKDEMTAASEVDRNLDQLRSNFDLIVMVAPPADRDPLATVLARHVDGNIIIVDAAKTRRSAALWLREILSRSGRPTIGTVLINRREYLPRWLSRLF